MAQHALTHTVPQRDRILTTECGIATPTRAAHVWDDPAVRKVVGIWDTGAQGTVIEPPIAAALNLQPSDYVQVMAVDHAYTSPLYVIDLYLPGLRMTGVQATVGKIGGAQVLIGMDVIGMGDFAVTTRGGLTTFTFSVPSERHLDFVHEAREAKVKEIHAAYGRKQLLLFKNMTDGSTRTERAQFCAELVRDGWVLVGPA